MGVIRRYRRTSGHAEQLPDKGPKTSQRKEERNKSLHKPRTYHYNHRCKKFIIIEILANHFKG